MFLSSKQGKLQTVGHNRGQFLQITSKISLCFFQNQTFEIISNRPKLDKKPDTYEN